MHAQSPTSAPARSDLAQIQLPADTDVECVRRKLVLDQCYVRSGSLWLDLRILLGTAVYLVGFPYGAVRKAVALPNPLTECEESDAESGPVPLAAAVTCAESR